MICSILKLVSDEKVNSGDNKEEYDDNLIMIMPDEMNSSSVHSQSAITNNNKCNQQEVKFAEYISVTPDMFVPPHKRT